MFTRRILMLKISSSIFRARPKYSQPYCEYVACFSSIPNHKKGFERQQENLGASGTDREDCYRGTKSGEDKNQRAEEAADSAKDTVASAAEMAKVGVGGAMEAGLRLGEAAKQSLDGMWDVARKTTENVRDTVVDREDDKSSLKNSGIDFRDEDDGGGHRRKEPSDNFVDDVRRRANGYDMKD